MAVGGVAYYLSLFERGRSVAQNIEWLCFTRGGELVDEFQKLFKSLFKKADNEADEDLKHGAQIDLLIDRSDKTITICEMKYSQGEYEVTKGYDTMLSRRLRIFRKATKTRKSLVTTFITPNGLLDNVYARRIVTPPYAHHATLTPVRAAGRRPLTSSPTLGLSTFPANGEIDVGTQVEESKNKGPANQGVEDG